MASRRHPEGMKLFALAANCLLQGEVMNTCAPAFTYPPAFAFFMIPFGPPPPLAGSYGSPLGACPGRLSTFKSSLDVRIVHSILSP